MRILDKSKIKEVEDIIGYTFTNEEYLINALTHPAYRKVGLNNYQRLEFLGDSLLNFIVSLWLYECFEDFDEGELTRARASMVSQKPLSNIVKIMGLEKYIIIDKKEVLSVSDRNLSDIFESLVAAIYFDGGFEKARQFALSKIEENTSEQESIMFEDYKSKVVMYCQKKSITMHFEYSSSGELHDLTFAANLTLSNGLEATGYGKSKKQAEQDACRVLLESI